MALLVRGTYLALVILSAHTTRQRNGRRGLVEDWVAQNRKQHGPPAVESERRTRRAPCSVTAATPVEREQVREGEKE